MIEFKVDLHMHSDHSDGENSVEEMIDQALNNGLSAIAFAEHFEMDPKASLLAYVQAMNYVCLNNLPIRIFPAVEYSIANHLSRKPKSIHCVIYPDDIGKLIKVLGNSDNEYLDIDHPVSLAHPTDIMIKKALEENMFPFIEIKKRVYQDSSLDLFFKNGITPLVTSDAHNISGLSCYTIIREIPETIWGIDVIGYGFKKSVYYLEEGNPPKELQAKMVGNF